MYRSTPPVPVSKPRMMTVHHRVRRVSNCCGTNPFRIFLCHASAVCRLRRYIPRYFRIMDQFYLCPVMLYQFSALFADRKVRHDDDRRYPFTAPIGGSPMPWFPSSAPERYPLSEVPCFLPPPIMLKAVRVLIDPPTFNPSNFTQNLCIFRAVHAVQPDHRSMPDRF